MSPVPFAKLSAAEVNDLLAAAALHIHDGVAITDAASRILWVNAAYCAMTGHSHESLIGRTPALLRPLEEGASRAQEIWDSLGACGRYHGRLLNQRADGSVFYAEITVVHAQSRAGDPGFYLCTMKDVSADVELEKHLARMADQAIRARDTTIFALASLAEQRDRDAKGHLARIESYATAMAEWLLAQHRDRLPECARDAQTIGRCAILHDIGKVGIPDSVLLKQGPLDAAEQDVMRQHPRLGAEILDRVILHQPESAFLRIARDIVAYHHEAFDGTGYPYGLSGDEIPLVAQVATVADVLDALTSRRPYKPAYRFDSALAWIAERRGSQFGPLAVAALLACSEKAAAIHAAFGDQPSDQGIAPSGIDRPAPAAARAPRHTPPAARARPVLMEALAEACASEGGEVVVRSGREVGRIYLWQGRVAWAHVSTERGVLTERLVHEHGLDEAEIRGVIEHCKDTDEGFGETLIAWGLMSREKYREVLRAHVATRLRAILGLPDAVALFVPQTRRNKGALTFSLDELWDEP